MALRNRLHRSELAVPGSNVRMLEKAPTAGADMVFLDLEDAVAPDDKAQARKNVIEALNDLDWSNCSVSVRINGLDTHYCYRDIVDVVEQAGDKLDTILIPKVGSPSDILFVSNHAGADRGGQGNQAYQSSCTDRNRNGHGECRKHCADLPGTHGGHGVRCR